MQAEDKISIKKEAQEKLGIGTECSNRNLGYDCIFTITSANFEWSTREPNSLMVTGKSIYGEGYYTVYRHNTWCNVVKLSFDKELEMIRKVIKED